MSRKKRPTKEAARGAQLTCPLRQVPSADPVSTAHAPVVKDRQPCGGVEVPLEVPRTPRVVEPILRARGGVYVDQHLEVIFPAELDEAVELFERAIPAANERLPRNEDPYEVSRKKRSESAQSEGVAWRSKRLALTVRDRDADDVGSRCCDGLDVLVTNPCCPMQAKLPICLIVTEDRAEGVSIHRSVRRSLFHALIFLVCAKELIEQ